MSKEQQDGSLVASEGEQVVLVVYAKGVAQAVEDAGGVVLPLERHAVLASGEVLRHLHPKTRSSAHENVTAAVTGYTYDQVADAVSCAPVCRCSMALEQFQQKGK